MSDEKPDAADDALAILHVVPYYPPDRIGGVGEVVAHVHEGLLARGHASRVLTSGTSTERASVSRIAATPARFAACCGGHAGLARGVDVVHLHHGEALGLILAMRLRRLTTPVLLTLHVNPAGIRGALEPFRLEGRTLGRGWKGLVHRTITMNLRHWLDRAAMRGSDQLSFISRSSARDVLPAREAERAVVIYNGLPPEEKPASDAVQPTELLYVGTFSTRKRVLALPFVLRHVRDRRPEVRVRVVGFDPRDHPELLELATQLGVREAFVFEGEMRSADLPPYYRASKVLLVPSAYEGLPMVILEGYRHRLPCVATRVSGIPEVIEDGVNGFLVDLDEPRQMAERAFRILQDPGLGQRMGQEGQGRLAERFGVSRQVDEYVELYHRIRARDRGRAEARHAGAERA
jgi:glycosyltransferase involved in cell wall biosynthesis